MNNISIGEVHYPNIYAADANDFIQLIEDCILLSVIGPTFVRTEVMDSMRHFAASLFTPMRKPEDSQSERKSLSALAEIFYDNAKRLEAKRLLHNFISFIFISQLIDSSARYEHRHHDYAPLQVTGLEHAEVSRFGASGIDTLLGSSDLWVFYDIQKYGETLDIKPISRMCADGKVLHTEKTLDNPTGGSRHHRTVITNRITNIMTVHSAFIALKICKCLLIQKLAVDINKFQLRGDMYEWARHETRLLMAHLHGGVHPTDIKPGSISRVYIGVHLFGDTYHFRYIPSYRD